MSNECENCGEHALDCRCPTTITCEDIDRVLADYCDRDIQQHSCINCSKKYIGSYGHHIGVCDECWFSKFPKKQVQEFCRSFF